jgi:hypothetical protein
MSAHTLTPLRAQGAGGRRVLQYSFSGAPPDRHQGGAVIGADDVGHDGRVGDAQALNELSHLTVPDY